VYNNNRKEFNLKIILDGLPDFEELER
ncbi:uncharacterized protein METZ01_LOCUS436983, partial [marine metagenome]